MTVQAVVYAALASLCGWIHFGDEIRTRSGHYNGKIAALGAWSCGQAWDYVPGSPVDANAAAARRSKAFVFFSGFNDNKPLTKVVGPEAAIPIDLEVKQVQAGVLWTMFTAVKDTLSQVTQSGLVKKVLDDIPKAVEASNKIAEALQRHPPPAPGNELAWIEWGKQLTSTKSFDFTKENDYHRPLDAEMKWLYTLLFDQGVQASLKARLSKMSTEWMVISYLYVTQEPCNFCVQMLLLHHPKLKAIYAPSDKQTLKVHVLAQAEYRKSSSTGYGQLSSAERQKVDIIPYWHTAGASLPAVL